MHPILKQFLCVMACAAAMTLPAFADASITVRHNGAPIPLPAPPFIEDGRTLVPLRTAFDIVGFEVDWDQPTLTATGRRQDFKIEITTGRDEALVNGAPFKLDVPAVLQNDRVYVPLRFVSEALGANVEWSASTQTVNIYTNHLRTKVFFKEPHLNAALHQRTGKPLTEDLTREDLIYITQLNLSGLKLTTLDEIGYLENLKTLNLENNDISELRPLESLKHIETLDLSDNNISSILYLRELHRLKQLDLRNNEISNIENIAFWPQLEEVLLRGNKLDTPEELAPLFYLKDEIKTDLDLTDIDEPVRNTWNLRSNITPYRTAVSDGLYWVPAIAFGISWNENEDMKDLVANLPGGRASKVRSLYDLLQYLQHAEWRIGASDKNVKDNGTEWVYTKRAQETLRDNSGSERALTNAAAYLLAQDYLESGVLRLVYSDGSEKNLNYIKTLRTFKEDDEDGEEVSRTVAEYGVFDIQSYLQGSEHPAAIETGRMSDYDLSEGIISNIHLTEDPLAFVKAYTGDKPLALAYTIEYTGDAYAQYPSSTTPPRGASGSRTLVLPKRETLSKTDDEYYRNPIESFYQIVYDNPSDNFYVKWEVNTTAEPVWE